MGQARLKDVHVRIPEDVVQAVRRSARASGRTFPFELAHLLRTHPSLAKPRRRAS